jgi:hypothetical protein
VKATSRRTTRPAEEQWYESFEPLYPTEDWTGLTEGAAVEVAYAAGHSYVGLVDAKTADSSVIWVTGYPGVVRRMYGHQEGVRLRRAAEAKPHLP